MIRNLFFFLLVVSTFFGCSTTGFTVDELRNLSKKNADDFESYVLSKGYELQTDYDGVLYNYSKKNGKDKVDPHDDIISWEQNKGERIVSYQSCNKEYHVKIKEELKSLNFVFIDSATTVKKMGENLYYRNVETLLTLVTIPESDENDLKASLYKVEIRQPMQGPITHR